VDLVVDSVDLAESTLVLSPFELELDFEVVDFADRESVE
jgi:hypothetical protein